MLLWHKLQGRRGYCAESASVSNFMAEKPAEQWIAIWTLFIGGVGSRMGERNFQVVASDQQNIPCVCRCIVVGGNCSCWFQERQSHMDRLCCSTIDDTHVAYYMCMLGCYVSCEVKKVCKTACVLLVCTWVGRETNSKFEIDIPFSRKLSDSCEEGKIWLRLDAWEDSVGWVIKDTNLSCVVYLYVSLRMHLFRIIYGM